MLGQGGLQAKAGAGTFTDSLKEGDVIKAELISNDRGSVAMKTESGQIIKARLDVDVGLRPGDEVQLEVRGKDKGLVLVSASRDEAVINETSGRPGLVGGLSDKSFEPYLNKLTELNMPVTKETAQLMRELIAQNPGMSLDEAAFLASNKLTGDQALMRAALALLAGGEKTDAIIARILALLNEPGAAGDSAAKAGVMQTLEAPSPNAPLPAGTGAITVSPLNAAPLTDLLTLVSLGAPGAAEALGQGAPNTTPVAQTIIAQSNIILQSTNVENNQEIAQNNALKGEQPQELPTTVLNNTANTAPSPPTALPLEPQSAVNPEFRIPNPEFRIPNSEFPTQNPSLHTQLAALLSELPEFRGTPPEALERFSNMLLRIAGESTAKPGNETEKIEALLDKLFTKIGRSDTDAGARLKTAREELFARLSLIEEMVSRASLPAKTEMLDHTQRLLQHVRLLNNIEQFGYVQLPVQFGEERKTAELYIFKRKGGRKPDSENVNILLAIDLENLGRWEALLNIRSKDISIQMEVRGAAEKEHFSENTVLLHELLAEAGFKLVSTSISYTEVDTTPLTALTSVGRYTTGRAGAIDFKI